MRICIDVQSAIHQRAGVGRYTKLLVEHLAPLRNRDELCLFYFDFQRKGMPFPVEGAHYHATRWIPGRVVQRAWRTLDWPPFNYFAGPADVYHFPNFIRPPLAHGKSVVTIHDLAFLRYPETIETKNYRYLTTHIRDTVARADAIITVSAFTAREVQELLGVLPSRIHPIFSGIVPPPPGNASNQPLRPRPYLLTVGTLEPRKNIPFLINVFERLTDFDGDLIIAGMKGWHYEPILARMKLSPCASRIHYLEYVEDTSLAALYTGAELFLFPSLYEGFGFPPLEAMACGTPVVASKAEALVEVLGDAAVLVSTTDADAWCAEIRRLLSDSARRHELAEHGRRHASHFTWENAARKTWNVYRNL